MPKPQDSGQQAQEFVEKIISINRVTKVTKGGKKLLFPRWWW
jgi:ribosomal protein S5